MIFWESFPKDFLYRFLKTYKEESSQRKKYATGEKQDYNSTRLKKSNERRVMKTLIKHKTGIRITVLILLFATLAGIVMNLSSPIYGSFLSLVPAFVSIALTLISKEVYSSLFIGILTGGLIYSGFSLEGAVLQVFDHGLLNVLSDQSNLCILIFLVVLGAIVVMMNHSGATENFGNWALKKIRNRKQAQLSTILLGILIFVDDNFNCLTVGNVMHPITDRYHVSREKLAYLIDSTAAPVCIIAPISSWAAAVAGFVASGDGFVTFLRTIPYNFYALFTIVMVLAVVIMNVDFGPMKTAEEKALTQRIEKQKTGLAEGEKKGKIIDLVLPILVLILFCTLGILYTGGFFEGNTFFDSFSQGNAALGLMYGSFISLLFTVVFYVSRHVVSFEKCMECIEEGFKIMVPAILILVLAWTLKSMTDALGATAFIKALLGSSMGVLSMFIPAFMFVVGALIAFATGTSWGTFGILIPMVINVFEGSGSEIMIISMAACMAGAVCGDHSSPISDTTIMASSGAGSDHIAHVTTQIPYVLVVAAVSLFAYLLTAVIHNVLIILMIGSLTLITILALIRMRQKQRNKQTGNL